MKKIEKLIVGIVLSLLVAGCGNGKYGTWNDGDRFTSGVIGVDIDLSYNEADFLYRNCYQESLGLDLSGGGYYGRDWACSKRLAAKTMAKEVFTYSFKNYLMLDGVSGLIYNVGYIFSVPHKALRGLRCMNGVGSYLSALFKLGLGTVAAAVGVVVAPVVNTVFHPFETLANLTVGIIHVDGIEFLDIHPSGAGCGWWGYMLHTNLVASLWDLIWGAMIHPLWQAATFWM